MSDPSDRLEDVARRNPNINPDRIRRYTQLTQRLQERGLWRRPAFNIDHPFATPRPSTSKRFAVSALPWASPSPQRETLMSDNLVTFIAHFTDGTSRYVQVERPTDCHPRDRKLYVMALDDAESDGSTVDRIAIPWHVGCAVLDANTRTRREIEQCRFRFG